MTTVLVTFADDAYAGLQAVCVLTAKRFGFDVCHAFGPADLDTDFRRRHEKTLNAARGMGYWLWKPYFIARTLASLNDGDMLFYSDAGTHFVNPIETFILTMNAHRLDLLVLGEGFVEAHYTKRDAFVLMQADTEVFVQTPQRFASCFMLRKTRWSERFVSRYLDCAQDERILTDLPNTCGLVDYPGFVEHRHDQSIFSLLSKQEQVPFVASGLVAEGLPTRGTQIVNHTRGRRTPKDIITYLLVQGILSPADLLPLTQPQSRSRPLPP